MGVWCYAREFVRNNGGGTMELDKPVVAITLVVDRIDGRSMV